MIPKQEIFCSKHNRGKRNNIEGTLEDQNCGQEIKIQSFKKYFFKLVHLVEINLKQIEQINRKGWDVAMPGKIKEQ